MRIQRIPVLLSLLCTGLFACGAPDNSGGTEGLQQPGSVSGDSTYTTACGGPCGTGAHCGAGTDCASQVCSAGYCAKPYVDGVLNGNESDLDCGGTFPTTTGNEPKCATGKKCFSTNNCVAGDTCVNFICTAPSCSDGITNGTETDVDCGGSCPNKCIDGKKCSVPGDCVGNLCSPSTPGAQAYCRVPNTCADHMKDGNETGVDCGGSCNPCASGVACNLNIECASGICTAHACAAPTCSDGVKNGTETGVDCGGGTCPACGESGICNVNADCATGLVCTNHICAVPDPTNLCLSTGSGTTYHPPVVCSPIGACVAGVCDPLNGSCYGAPFPNGTSCSAVADPNAVGAGSCQTGVCAPTACATGYNLVSGACVPANQVVLSISPTSGPGAGGQLITATGLGFGPWTSGASIQIPGGASAACTNIHVIDSQHFTCTTDPIPNPAGGCGSSSGVLDFSVQNSTNSAVSTLPSSYTVSWPGLFASGSGTAVDPFIVATRTDLDNVRNCPTASFLQSADIDVSGCDSFTPFPSFGGTYDGATKKISNFCSTTSGAGLFRAVSGTLQNLRAENFSISNLGSQSGGLVGHLYGTIQGSSISGTVSASANTTYRGGMVGFEDGAAHVLNSSSAVDVTVGGGGYTGVLVGLSVGEITGCTATGNITAGAAYCVGGLVGFSVLSIASVNSSSAHGAVTTTGYDVGGLVGCLTDSTVVGSSATGAVSGQESVGGLVGAMDLDQPLPTVSLVQDSYATGSVTGSNGYFFGGLVGGGNFFGPVGCAKGSIVRSYATGNVSGWYYFVGGLVGASCLDIVDSYALGNVSGGTPSGGLVGASFGPNTPAYGFWGAPSSSDHLISGSFAAGAVSGADGLAPFSGFPGGTGGLVGANWTNIDSSHALGSVRGLGDPGAGVAAGVGGLVGVNLGAIANVYAAAQSVDAVDASSNPLAGQPGVFALVGVNTLSAVEVSGSGWRLALPGDTPTLTLSGSVTDGYYEINGGAPADALGTGLSAGQLSSSASFSGFDFTTPLWRMPSADPLNRGLLSPVQQWQCGKNGVTCF